MALSCGLLQGYCVMQEESMTALAVWLLFGIKHWAASHLLDAGYSYSRDTANRWWLKGLLVTLLVEAGLTALLLWFFQGQHLHWAYVLESGLLVAACVMERRAPITRLFRTHLICECTVALCYGVVAMKLVNV